MLYCLGWFVYLLRSFLSENLRVCVDGLAKYVCSFAACILFAVTNFCNSCLNTLMLMVWVYFQIIRIVIYILIIIEVNMIWLLSPKKINKKLFFRELIEDVFLWLCFDRLQSWTGPTREELNLKFQVSYKADYVEHLDKTVIVYCNVQSSPINLWIKGNAR